MNCGDIFSGKAPPLILSHIRVLNQQKLFFFCEREPSKETEKVRIAESREKQAASAHPLLVITDVLPCK